MDISRRPGEATCKRLAREKCAVSHGFPFAIVWTFPTDLVIVSVNVNVNEDLREFETGPEPTIAEMQ
jgi:hypothetical protein